MRFFGFLIAFVLLADTGASSADPVEINVILALTGSGALLGNTERTALQGLERRVNETGGIDRRPLHFTILDDQSNPQVAVQLATQLIAKDVKVILGSSLVGSCNAIAPLLKNGPVLYCFSPGLHPPPGSFAFTAGISSHDLMVATVRYFRARNLKRIAWISTTDASGQDGEAALDDGVGRAENSGAVVVTREHFAIADLNVDAQMARIKAANPDVIMTWASGTPMGTVLHGIANAGLDQIPIMISAANLNYGAMKQYGTLLPPNSYTMTNATYGADLVTDRAWKAAIGDLAGAIKPLGARLDYLQTNSWDPGSIVVSALRKLGPDASAEQIRNYIANLKGFYGVNGAYDFRAVPQRGLDDRGSYMVHWDGPNEAFVTVSKAGGIPTR